MTKLNVLVPIEGTQAALIITAQSGIVGCTAEGGNVLVHMEGNLYDSVNMRTWPDRIFHAAGRAKENYPTIARGSYAETDFIQVGIVDVEQWTLHLSPKKEERDALNAWVGSEGASLPALIDLKAWSQGQR